MEEYVRGYQFGQKVLRCSKVKVAQAKESGKDEIEDGKFDRSVADVAGELLVVSQFTLYGDCRKGRRPSFTNAAAPEVALTLFEKLLDMLKESGIHLITGEFQTMMQVGILNEGPVTVLLDSKKNL
ncbi:MAG TPA: D-tyrosyl-tRNA(Tyr) deacylase [Peptococcaceae bacterium]|nr:D-tyrosyl-tRNA(Tyr) deacylase [Peptococcaceae bacterium]